ncbi:hypothetical protein PPYR_05294 [Photinus pyralis]|uniref:Cupin-like domain-containing protein n=1 Tax=Photinus pyralis TaxID=7054 RepID=A0A5N4AUP9_PHOPY|nr:uncharacterized protein LOC116166043 [Photinus pyralis]KAB0800940.1 hypothetical protein PPYR_05294 [Photinus pyralis]
MQKAEKRFNSILQKTTNSKISCDELLTLDVVHRLCGPKKGNTKVKCFIFVIVVACMWWAYFGISSTSECLVEMPFESSKIFREPENCGICLNTFEVPKVENISKQNFEQLYVNTGKPVVVTDGTKNWLAMQTFSFNFFKQLYQSVDQHISTQSECQFFPYKTEFTSLAEALNMSVERSRLEPETLPWYIGWSNCNDKAGNILREYYNRPYFLPDNSESIALSWIFMGGPGFGAHMHVDNVLYPSWQAQIRGKKLWRLAPPPECFYRCREMEVTVSPGDIIVVDTNRWYHQTHILPGGVSITIGSEFD